MYQLYINKSRKMVGKTEGGIEVLLLFLMLSLEWHELIWEIPEEEQI